LSLGYRYHPKPFTITNHTIRPEGRCFLLVTDGIATQIGGAPPHMMGSRHLHALLKAAKTSEPKKLVNALMRGLRQWQSMHHRRDDVMILAFKPDEEERC
jgi:serine phosphatase RsbU (regulator of sigma subunit)